ncbi:MAG: hypothetical protein WAV32_06830 [Halobacteriota archaeon]
MVRVRSTVVYGLIVNSAAGVKAYPYPLFFWASGIYNFISSATSESLITWTVYVASSAIGSTSIVIGTAETVPIAMTNSTSNDNFILRLLLGEALRQVIKF